MHRLMKIFYVVDPARLYRDRLITNAVETLNNGNIIQSPGDMDEGLFQKEMINSMSDAPRTVIIGSSHHCTGTGSV